MDHTGEGDQTFEDMFKIGAPKEGDEENVEGWEDVEVNEEPENMGGEVVDVEEKGLIEKGGEGDGGGNVEAVGRVLPHMGVDIVRAARTAAQFQYRIRTPFWKFVVVIGRGGKQFHFPCVEFVYPYVR